MANLLSRVRGKTFYLLILSALFISGCSDDDDKEVAAVPVPNSAPVITSADTDTAAAGTLFTYTLTASDADGDTITFRASLLPAWLTFNATSGELSGTPARADAGDYEVTLAASDGVNSTPLFLNLSVVVVNAAPTITSIANKNGVVGASYSYTLTATDIDGDTLVKSAVSTLPSWASFDAATGTISGTPDAEGDVAVELSVSDGALSTNQEFTLIITSVPSVVIGFDETVVFSDFGGAITDVIANPDPTEVNPSANVARMQKFAGELFGGSTITFDSPINLEANVQNRKQLSSASFSGKSIAANNIFQLKVWSQRQVALTFKLEGDVDANDVERVVSHDGTGWEVLSFDFTDVSGTGYTGITLIFDNGVAGDAAEDAANWTFYFDDMVIPFVAIDDGGGSTQGPELVVNGGFDAGFASWNEIGLIVMEDGNSIFQADVQAAGNSFDVSLQQVLALEADKDYILTFRAKASVARGMIAGIGLNYAPWTNAAQDIALTTEWQTFTINLTTTGFGDANNRVFFDMGAEVGVVSIDDVSLSLASVDSGTGGGAEGPELAVNGGFDAGFASWNEIGLIVMEDGNNIFQADVQAAGNSFDVSLQQVLALEADKDYILTFRAKASVARGMIAGIGLNYAPWTNAAQDIALTTEWQTFTINLTTTGFGDANNRVFFDMGAEVGVVSIDDVSLKLATVDDGDDGSAGGGAEGPELAVNGGFDAGFASWNEIGLIVMEDGNNIFQADVQAAGNSFDVSLQQVLALEADKDYILTFRAKASVARGMIAGIGLNYAPWTNAAQDIAMTTEWQTFTINLTTTGFGDANNRVFFDMGAEVGVVSIDDVSLKLAAVDDGDNGAGGADTGAQLTNNGDFEVGNLSGWEAAENGGSITADNTQDSGSTWVAHVVAGPGNSPALSQAGLAVGTVMPGDTIDISFDMCGSAVSGGVIFPALLSEFGGGTGADRQNLATIAVPPSVWTRYNYSAVAGGNVTGGVSLQLDVVCGTDAACSTDVYFDNVSVTIGGGVAPGAASGNSCIAGDTGGGDPGAGGGAEPGDEVAVNGSFDNGFEGWNQVGNIVTEGDNSFLLVDVTAAGNPWDVNLSQVVTLVQDANYILSFKAKASVSRSIIAGIGQNYAPYESVTETIALGTDWVTYTLNLTATGFGDANNRILFDMGAEVGAVSLDDISLTLVSSDGGSGGGGTDPVEPLVVELVVFEDEALPEWAAWTDGKGPTEVLQDGDNGAVTKFTLTGPTVAGFTSRDGGGAVNGMTFDASALTNGIITFDLKMVKAPDAGLVDWKFKVESSTSTGAEVSLSTSYEGHATPVLDTWQTYSFPISALVDKGLDAANIDLFMVFPDYNSATGAEFYLDNFKITSGGDIPASVGSSSMSGGDLVINVAAGINFEGTEAEQASWDVFENVSNPALEFVANPSTVGNETAQVAKITLETAAAGSGKFAGAVTRTVQQFALNSSNAIVKIWVYKDKISPVGVKFEKFNGDGYGSHGELTVSNTKVNEWEQLTIDFTNEIGRPENDAITGIAIFPDMVDGRTATVAYFDEITFTSN